MITEDMIIIIAKKFFVVFIYNIIAKYSNFKIVMFISIIQ